MIVLCCKEKREMQLKDAAESKQHDGKVELPLFVLIYWNAQCCFKYQHIYLFVFMVRTCRPILQMESASLMTGALLMTYILQICTSVNSCIVYAWWFWLLNNCKRWTMEAAAQPSGPRATTPSASVASRHFANLYFLTWWKTFWTMIILCHNYFVNH